MVQAAAWRSFASALTLTAALASSTGAQAQASARQHDAHVHGRGALDVVLEHEALYVEVRMPAADVLGFEHAPNTRAERAAVAEARGILEAPARIIETEEAARCQPAAAAQVVFTAEAGEHDHGSHHAAPDDQAEPEAHHETEHDAHHESEHGAHHESEHGAHHEGGHEAHDEAHADAVHSEVHASYRFRCAAPERLETLRVGLFELFSGLERLDVQAIGPGGQRGGHLTPSSARLVLPR